MRIVVKVGTSTLTYATGHLNIRGVEELCKVLSDIKNAGNEVVLVSSGAIGMGVGKLNLSGRPADMPGKQAAAAVGQCELMYFYDRTFSGYSHPVGQLLLTGEDFQDEARHTNFVNTLERLLELSVLPIINENDTVSTEEISFGDNDTLGALVAKSIHADLLVVLSDTAGLYTKDPHKNADAKLIPVVTEITEELKAQAGGRGSALSTGGMAAKIAAASIAMDAGIDMVITDGKKPEDLYRILDGEAVGTRFVGKQA